MLYLDLDGFKQINDWSGHVAGDLLLGETARRLEGTVREYDTVARVGGDEFVILVEEIADDTPLEIAARVIAELRRPFRINDEEVLMTTSLGIAVFPHAADNVEDLAKRADGAMYTAKQRGAKRLPRRLRSRTTQPGAMCSLVRVHRLSAAGAM